MITIRNEQKQIEVNIEQLKHEAQLLLNYLGYSDFDLGILLCSDADMQKYNKEYRDKDKVTDILSFPYYPKLNPGEKITPKTPDDKNLGDIIIAPAYVQEDLVRWNQSFLERMQVLLVHGLCHLLGYDHITDEDYAVMKEKEDHLLKLLTSS